MAHMAIASAPNRKRTRALVSKCYYQVVTLKPVQFCKPWINCKNRCQAVVMFYAHDSGNAGKLTFFLVSPYRAHIRSAHLNRVKRQKTRHAESISCVDKNGTIA